MQIEQALEIMKNKDELRFSHIYGTYEKASYLASKYNIDGYKCKIAAILHDYAKNESIEYMQEIIKNYLDVNELKYDPVTHHGIVGAHLVKEDFNIEDKDIIDAIKYHVTGHPNMNDIGKIVYISDYIEINRKHPGVMYCRYLSEKSLDLAVVGIAEQSLEYLYKTKNDRIHPLSLETYNKFLEKVGALYYDTIRNNYKGL